MPSKPPPPLVATEGIVKTVAIHSPDSAGAWLAVEFNLDTVNDEHPVMLPVSAEYAEALHAGRKIRVEVHLA